jgi:hypothetical protein
MKIRQFLVSARKFPAKDNGEKLRKGVNKKEEPSNPVVL